MNWCRLSFEKLLKMAHLSPPARLLHVTATTFSAGNLTDGRIRKCDLPVLCAASGAKQAHVKELMDDGMWESTSDGWLLTDYLREQSSSEKIEADREAARKRKLRYAEKNGVRNGVPDGARTRSEHRKEEEEEEEEEEREVSTEALGIQDLGGAGGGTGANGALPVGSGDFLRSVSTIPETEADRARKAELRGQLERLKRGGSR